MKGDENIWRTLYTNFLCPGIKYLTSNVSAARAKIEHVIFERIGSKKVIVGQRVRDYGIPIWNV